LLVAKGNDGNYLQHSIEVASAVRLGAMDAAGRIHIALAHGMAPFEPCDASRSGQSRGLLERALNASFRPQQTEEPPIVSAYRSARASLTKYPNSAELLRCAIGREKLSGGITEVDPAKYEQLEAAWSGSQVFPKHSSWRCQIESGGVLACPNDLETPWLFALDPMTYHEEGYADDSHVYRADLERLSAVVKGYVSSRRPGLVALFVYGVGANVRPQFWSFLDDLASCTGTDAVSCWTQHRWGNRNLACCARSASFHRASFPKA
jgi:hypothetical protein